MNARSTTSRASIAGSDSGSVTLEAALAVPFFLALLLAMIAVVRLTAAELALHHAVSETVKQMSANAYPAMLLSQEAARLYEETAAGEITVQLLEKIRSAREMLQQGESWAGDYRAFVPDFMLNWIEWEKRQRELAEHAAAEHYESLVEEHVAPLIRAAFKEALLSYANLHVLKEQNLIVSEVKLPMFSNPEKQFLSVEVEYVFRLPIPFVSKTIKLKKRAYERIWTGAR